MIAARLDEPRSCAICSARTSSGVLVDEIPVQQRREPGVRRYRVREPRLVALASRAICDRCVQLIAGVSAEGRAA